jgi:hypothetical protein
MAEFTLALSEHSRESPDVKPMDRWAELPIMEKKMESLGKILAGAFLSLHARCFNPVEERCQRPVQF